MSAEDNAEEEERGGGGGGTEGKESGILADYVRSLREMQEQRPRRTELHDDYAFLDEDEELEDEDIFVERPQNSLGSGGGGLKKGRNLNHFGGGDMMGRQQMRDRWARRKRVKRE